jgi:uncharacterized membrane protein
MRFEIRERPYDLYTILAASALLVLIILIFPGLDTLRIIIGLPFILFFPGYVLISALYPERKRYFDSDGKEVPSPSDDGSQDDDEKDEGTIKGKGLDGLERIALSLGLSIAITPLIGLVLNYTYDWAPDTLGIRLVPILLSQFTFILIVGSIAIYKRSKVPLEDRFAIIIDLTIPENYSRMDKVLTVGIVLMMVLSVGMLIYIIVVPREGESFTEFYILGPSHKAEGYPRNIYLEESHFIYIGIGNHEHKEMNYTLVISMDEGALNQTMDTFDNVTVSRSRQPSMNIKVEDDTTLEVQCNFSILEVGSYKLRFLLFRNDEEYRDLHIWIKVFQGDHLARSDDGQMEVYLAGPLGDPSLLPDQIAENAPLLLSYGIRNGLDEDHTFNVTFRIDQVSTWTNIGEWNDTLMIGSGAGAYSVINVNSTSTSGPHEVSLELPDGSLSLVISFGSDHETFVITHSIQVGDK